MDSSARLAEVAVARPVRGGPFTYSVPPELTERLVPGTRVRVPFGRGEALGIFLDWARSPSAAVAAGLKPIREVLDVRPAIPADVMALVRFASDHYRYPFGEALRTALPPGLAEPDEGAEPEPEQETLVELLRPPDAQALRRAPAQQALISYLAAVGGRAPLDELVVAIPGARDPLKRLVARGWVRLEQRAAALPASGFGQAPPERLTEAQCLALEAINASLEAGAFDPFLLHGVTGSGKTEIYLRAAERTMALGRGALVLVPEIALTPQLVGRFRGRFGPAVAVLHSGLRDKERLRAWHQLRAGKTRLAVGVRSAVFAPVQDLGLLVVDEEHDPSFKQEEKLRYQARDLAVVRAKQCSATLLLGSATPSLESYENARRGRYRLIQLPGRVDDRSLPPVQLVDLRARPRPPAGDAAEILSEPLVGALEETLGHGHQAILFLNRRGHSSCLLCSVCGEPVRCPNCEVSLTLHKSPARLLCHYCAQQQPVPRDCPRCASPLLQLGMGTERVEAEVASRFPRSRVARLDRDSAGSAEQVTELLSAFARRELDVLIGTQMVAKGHDFPGVTLVCVVMADTALNLPDFRAAERTFQLLTQVAGRAGRGADPGKVVIQTYNPEAEAVRRAVGHDYLGFVDQELAWRSALAYPPFVRLAAVRVEAADPARARAAALELGALVERHLGPPSGGLRLLGPAPAPIPRLRGRSRWQLLLKGPTHAALVPLLARLERALEALPRTVKAVIDVDPVGML